MLLNTFAYHSYVWHWWLLIYVQVDYQLSVHQLLLITHIYGLYVHKWICATYYVKEKHGKTSEGFFQLDHGSKRVNKQELEKRLLVRKYLTLFDLQLTYRKINSKSRLNIAIQTRPTSRRSLNDSFPSREASWFSELCQFWHIFRSDEPRTWPRERNSRGGARRYHQTSNNFFFFSGLR